MPLVFISYSHVDEKWLKEIEPHLRMLGKRIEIEVWRDRQIELGDDWRDKIRIAID